MPTNNPRGISPDPLLPPPQGGQLSDPAWTRWFFQLYQMLMADGATFPKVGVQGRERVGHLANHNLFQELITLDCGMYSDYTSASGSIIYGFAANVKRSAGTAFVVGQQINAWGDTGTGSVFGQALVAVGQNNFTEALIGSESMTFNMYNDNRNAKWGYNAVFANKGPTPVLGGNRYNYFACGMVFSSEQRDAVVNEFCGWTRGLLFVDWSLDSQNPPAWNAAVTYGGGQVVLSGGQCWQSIQANVNQLPAFVSVYWVPNSGAGDANARAIGIDFSSMGVTTIARMGSAIRLRDTMKFGWESSGVIYSQFDPALGRLTLVGNAANARLAVDVATGFLYRNGVFLI